MYDNKNLFQDEVYLESFAILFQSVEPVPLYYTMMLESLDGIGSNLRVNISVQRDGETVTMQIEKPLPSKCLWSASILPYNCEANMQVAELSKLHHYCINCWKF